MNIQRNFLYGLEDINITHEDLKQIIKKFVSGCSDDRLRQAYDAAVSMMHKANNLLADVLPSGQYWEQLVKGVSNIEIQEINHLNYLFMDAQIEM